MSRYYPIPPLCHSYRNKGLFMVTSFCLIEGRAMVEAVQQPSAECTAILTLYIVEHPPPPFAVTIYKTCTDQLWSEPIGLEAKLWLLCFCNSMHIVEVYFTGSPSAKFPIWVEFVVCHLIDLIWSLTTLKLIIWNSPNFNVRSYQINFVSLSGFAVSFYVGWQLLNSQLGSQCQSCSWSKLQHLIKMFAIPKKPACHLFSI